MTPLARAKARCRDLRASCDTNQVGAAEDIEPALELLKDVAEAARALTDRRLLTLSMIDSDPVTLIKVTETEFSRLKDALAELDHLAAGKEGEGA